ncbi:MAG: RNA polymerase II transcription factor B subunit 1 [Sclerophora amabilis]|nr:MAG: RNA polymerase II transcription factor B subunit 1 [Sclerophora amabilis]
MPPPKGSATYKKKEGTLIIARDLQSISWTPITPPGAPPALKLMVSSITNLQQTPASSAKVMLKIFAQPPNMPSLETHIFSFTSPTVARAEADAIKDTLSSSIQAGKATSNQSGGAQAADGGRGGGSSAAMAIASAVSSGGSAPNYSKESYDDDRLKSDVELQSSLLKSNPSLQRTFMELLRTKPDSISNLQFTSQFWSTRTRLLRAHAIEKSQSRGAYNVLSALKTTTEDNVTRMNVSKEQIQLIFSQHPLVKRVYDENVPKLDESTFWSKFFLSRLFKKLKGEKIVESDPLDPVLDKYLHFEDEDERSKRLLGAHIPHIIDVEGNEENHSQRKGNKPDLTMRPSSAERVPIMRVLNNLSERIMARVAPADVNPSDPIGMDEETFNELALRDLQGDAKENRIILNIKDQRRFFSSDKRNDDPNGTNRFAGQNPSDVIDGLAADLDPSRKGNNSGGGLNLQNAIGIDEEDNESDDENSNRRPHVGSKTSLSSATKQVLGAIHQRRSQSDDLTSTGTFSDVQVSPPGLDSAIFDRLCLTHATTTEFLHHFWLVFLSGDPDRAADIAQLAESLNRAMERIQAVANDAEEARTQELERKKKEIREVYQATGKKMKFNSASVGGGSKTVKDLLEPTIKALGLATAEYKKALKAEGVDTV